MIASGRSSSHATSAIDHPFTNDQRLRRAERLLKRTEFKACERFGARKGGRSLVIYAAPNGLQWSRLGLTVSRKAGNAVRRARWKRRLREVFRRNKPLLPVGYDLVVIVRSSTRGNAEPTIDALREEFIELAGAAQKRADKKQGSGGD